MRILENIKKIITNPRYAIVYLNNLHLFNYLSDELFHKLMYYAHTGCHLKLDNPKGFNEKLHWLMIYDRNPIYTTLVDKYAVRSYIKEKIGSKYLIPLLCTYNNADEINFDSLPDSFVLKCNHNSGSGLVICKDKKNANYNKIRKTISNGLKKNGYFLSREWPYKNVKPLIICEKYMSNDFLEENGIDGLLDYKFYCFHGIPKFLYVGYADIDRNNVKHDILSYYDLSFNKTSFFRKDHKEIGFTINKPKCFDEMIKIAGILSEDIPFVRVDLYEINGEVYFSELTLYPGAGFGMFYPEEWENNIGNYIELSNIK